MKPGDTIPSCQFSATSNIHGNFDDYRGKWLILYFYPKDATPGCTKEGRDFRDNHKNFTEKNCVIFGISRDTLASHEKFKSKQGFQFELISDTDEKICTLFDVIKVTNIFGKKVRGIKRCTFLIDPNGKIKHAWHKVVVKGHIDEILVELHK